MKVKLAGNEKEKLKYYIYVEKKGKWINIVNGYYTYRNGIWNYMYQNRKKYQGLPKKLIVKQINNNVIENRDVTDKDILDYKKGKKESNKMPAKKREKFENNYCYLFEIKNSVTTPSGIFVVTWENPLNSAFYNALDAWGFIIRNREKFKDSDKRLKTISTSTGEIVYNTPISEDLITDMERDNFPGTA